MRNEEIIKASKIKSDELKMSVMCKCGKKNHFFAFEGDKKVCSWCGRMVFRTKKDEFKYRVKENIIKNKRKELVI